MNPTIANELNSIQLTRNHFFDTEQEALVALFEQFKEKVKNKLDFFGKEANRLGIKQELRLL